jgi:hypothetical protein
MHFEIVNCIVLRPTPSTAGNIYALVIRDGLGYGTYSVGPFN